METDGNESFRLAVERAASAFSCFAVERGTHCDLLVAARRASYKLLCGLLNASAARLLNAASISKVFGD